MKETPSNSSAVSTFRDRGDCSSIAVNLNDRFEFREDPSFWKDHNVQVIVRVRPLSDSEIDVHGPRRCVKQGSSQTITWTGTQGPETRFTFDCVADEHVSQELLFRVAGAPMVENCMGGYNSCMFAYGQTGSGKTYTMLGDMDGGSRSQIGNSGMTTRVFKHLFTRIEMEREARREEQIQYTCKCSFLEIYNEQISDLLVPLVSNLQIRENKKIGVYVENLKEVEVTSAQDAISQLKKGRLNRKVGSTKMNHASSRSHSVFTCIIESKWVSQGVTHRRFARLNLVDLAGSERQKKSGAEGACLKKAANINKSLSTLGLVIMNLANVSNGKSVHVPYRDSKLTFLLQPSLGGNSKTTIIANISPSSCNSLETLSTLKFAQRAKYITNHATINEDASEDVLAMRMQIQQLKNEVSRLQSVINGKITAETQLLKEKEEHIKELELLRSQVDRNQEETLSLKEEIRRLKSFYEGKQESMKEQIMILDEKLREALHWGEKESEMKREKERLYEKAMQEIDELKRLLSSIPKQCSTSPMEVTTVDGFKFVDEPKVQEERLSKSSESLGMFRSLAGLQERLHLTTKQSEAELKNNIKNTNRQIGGFTELLKSVEEKAKLQLQITSRMQPVPEHLSPYPSHPRSAPAKSPTGSGE